MTRKLTVRTAITALTSGSLQEVVQTDKAFDAFLLKTGIKVVSDVLYFHYGDHGRTRTIRTFWATVSKTNAKKILELYNAHNRARVTGKVVDYGLDIRLNRWEVNGETIKFSLDSSGETTQLIDGSHRMEATAAEGKSQPFLMVVGISPNAFKTIDQQNRRTVRDAFTTHGKNFTTERHGLVSLISRFEEDRLNEHRSTVPNINKAFNLDEKYDRLIEESLDFAMVTAKTCSIKISKSTIALLYMLLSQKSRFLAAKFLTALVSGAELSASSPILKLRNLFVKEDQARANGDVDLARYMNERRMAKIVPVWNAVCRNRKIGNHLRFDDKVSYAKSLTGIEAPVKFVEADAETWFNNEWPKIAKEALDLRSKDLSRRDDRSHDVDGVYLDRIREGIDKGCAGIAALPIYEMDVLSPVPTDVVNGTRSTNETAPPVNNCEVKAARELGALV